MKIEFPLPPGTAFGGESESVWAEQNPDGNYRIKNVPFFVQGVSFGDVVRAEQKNDQLVFKDVVQHSGHSTYRIFAHNGRHQPQVVDLLAELNRLHCTYEAATEKLVGIDVPPEADIREVYHVLENAEEQGLIDFQEGHCGHSV